MEADGPNRRAPRATHQFSQYVADHLGWYVYALRDPRDQRVFYVGKGAGNRVFQHAKAAAVATDSQEAVSPKITQIREIIAAGLDVDALILRHGIASEKAAYDVEAAVIDMLRLLDPDVSNDRFELTNLVLGHHHASRGLVNADVAASLYDAPKAPPILAPSILFRVPTLWTPQMSADDLYRTTRGWWKVGPKPRASAEYAFAVSKGVIRGVYRIASWVERAKGDRDWEQDLGKRPRWGFDGTAAPEMSAWLNTSVAHLFKQGEANPVKAINLKPLVSPDPDLDSIAFAVSDDGIVLDLLRSDTGLSVRRNGCWVGIDSSSDHTIIDGLEWIDVTDEGVALWDASECFSAPLTREDALKYAADPGSIAIPAGPGAAAADLPIAGWRRATGSLRGLDPWDGLGCARNLPLLWALRPIPGEPAGWCPPDPRNPDGSAANAFLAPWWTPLMHLTQFQMGLRRPGAHLAWLRSDPLAATAHSPVVTAQFALMDEWWGAEAIDDFIAWAVISGDESGPEADDGGMWPSDGAVPPLSDRQRAFYVRRAESTKWQGTWGGGHDVMHLWDHTVVPYSPVTDRSRDLRWEEDSAGLRLVAPDYAGWYGGLLARGRDLREPTRVDVTIEEFGPLGTFELGAGIRPRLIAYPEYSAWPRATKRPTESRFVWTEDQVTITRPNSSGWPT